MTIKTSDEVVVITGGTAGVGRATARAFARRGAKVAVLARGRSGLAATEKEIHELGGTPLAIPCDVADAEAVHAAAAAVEQHLGPIDIWINNAMTTVFGRLTSLSPEEFHRVIDVTLHGTLHGTQAALHSMIPRNRGHIVQVGSALAYRAIPLQSAYCAAKHGVRAFTDSLRSELIHDGRSIQLTMVHLPGLNTPQFDWCRSHMSLRAQPVPPIMQPEAAARAIYAAAHGREREVLVGGATLKTVWGQKVLPGWLDHYLARAAFEGQMVDAPDPPGRPDNLFEPVEGDRGARGRFDQAHDHDLLAPVNRHLGEGGMRGVATAAVVAGLVALGFWAARAFA